MFLKRIKPNKRILYNKFFIDPWANIILKKKIRNRSTQRFLQFFARYVAKKFIEKHFGWKKRHQWKARLRKRFLKRKRWKRRISPGMKKFKALLASMRQKPVPKRPPIRPKVITPLKKFILSRVRFYKCYRSVVVNPLMGSWLRKFKYMSQKFLRKWRYQPYATKFFWLKRKPEYRVTQLMDLVFQQYHFGFTSFASFKSYIKHHGGEQLRWKTSLSLGVEGMLANQLCRTSLLINIRWGYLLVRSGAILVNKTIETNPRRVLRVGDSFKIAYPFSILVFRHYKHLLAMRKVVFNIMPYFEYNLKLLAFKIWRKPSKRERALIVYYPFFKNELTNKSIRYFKWITE